MREIVVISGKGGTGKTTVCASFAHLAESKVICDLDVDAPDLHILLQPEVKQAGKEQIKKNAKASTMETLAKAKINADRDNRERWEREGRIAPAEKNDMEL